MEMISEKWENGLQKKENGLLKIKKLSPKKCQMKFTLLFSIFWNIFDCIDDLWPNVLNYKILSNIETAHPGKCTISLYLSINRIIPISMLFIL